MGRIAERSLPLDPSMSAPWSTPPRESGAQQGITSDSFDSRFCQSVADPKPPKLWVIESFTVRIRFIEQIFGADEQVPGRRSERLRTVRPCVLQSGKGRILPSI